MPTVVATFSPFFFPSHIGNIVPGIRRKYKSILASEERILPMA